MTAMTARPATPLTSPGETHDVGTSTAGNRYVDGQTADVTVVEVLAVREGGLQCLVLWSTNMTVFMGYRRSNRERAIACCRPLRRQL